jgi:CheY-like chemotaxis protein
MKKILYVEDSSMAQRFMRRVLEDVAELTISASLPVAERCLKSGHFDLVIADYLFPEGDALAFMRNLRQSHTVDQLPLVIISGSMDRLLLSQVLKAGANDAFAKPLDVEKFKAAIVRMLAQPYVRSADHGAIGVCCFQWMTNGTYYQFCPDLGLITSGPTKAAAASQMFDALKTRMKQWAQLGGVLQERIVTHIIESP